MSVEPFDAFVRRVCDPEYVDLVLEHVVKLQVEREVRSELVIERDQLVRERNDLQTELRQLKMESEREPPPEAGRWSVEALDATYQSMLLQPGAAIRFELERTPEAIARDNGMATFSPGAVDRVLMGMRAWLYSRIHRAYDELGAPARQGEIVVHVELRP